MSGESWWAAPTVQRDRHAFTEQLAREFGRMNASKEAEVVDVLAKAAFWARVAAEKERTVKARP